MPEEKQEMTLGEARCHINFNPSEDSDIDKFKRMCADAIDFLHLRADKTEDSEIGRCLSIAMTEIETAQMYGVKAIAKTLQK
jgi:hypothetical protein